MMQRYDPRIVCRNVRIEGWTKIEVFNRVKEKLETGKWEVVHPMRSYLNAYENLVYYITLERIE
ncbi:hypothetical protein DCC39_14465 [Pueribacillus theae]|uniref:Uncharacterized protein n=1 Tax=Pueribacillus theae TaxID=2171751 RepID=A0A2U1JUY6_9BACI|nr:hypothetical protein DCC39_14465 [Pueribacillus theae]